MSGVTFPERLKRLHDYEEDLREEALGVVTSDGNLQLHLLVIEQSMDLADLLRQFRTEDEDLKVIQVLGMRAFNAFCASLKVCIRRRPQG